MKIEVKNLVKNYGDKKILKEITVNLNEPKIYGLLGRNGAGKTTFMELIAGQTSITSGNILVDGQEPFDNAIVTSRICLIKEGGNFKPELRIKQILKVFSYFYPSWSQSLAEELVGIFNLDLNAKVKTLSKGMESALGIVVGLASRSPVTIFDEPYIGMDAAARKRFYEILLGEYESEPRTIIFSTHLIDEAALLFEEVIIFSHGSLVMHEAADVLRESTCAITGNVAEIEQFIANRKVIATKQLAGIMTAYIYCSDGEDMGGFQAEGIPIQELMIHLTEEAG